MNCVAERWNVQHPFTIPSKAVLAVAVSVHYCGQMYHGEAYLFHKFFVIDSVHVECKRTFSRYYCGPLIEYAVCLYSRTTLCTFSVTSFRIGDYKQGT